MSTRIHINLNDGLIEAEGSEEFVKYIYESAKDLFLQKAKPPKTPPVDKNHSDDKTIGGTTKKKPQQSTKTPKIVPDLNLRPNDGKDSLDIFYASLSIKNSSKEQNLVFIYYMQKILGLTRISMDSVYTCYKHIKKIKVPGNLYQSLADTKNKKGWIDTSNMEELKVTIPGENYLEHDMQKKTEG